MVKPPVSIANIVSMRRNYPEDVIKWQIGTGVGGEVYLAKTEIMLDSMSLPSHAARCCLKDVWLIVRQKANGIFSSLFPTKIRPYGCRSIYTSLCTMLFGFNILTICQLKQEQKHFSLFLQCAFFVSRFILILFPVMFSLFPKYDQKVKQWCRIW